MKPTTNTSKTSPKQTPPLPSYSLIPTMAHRTTHRRNLAAPPPEPDTSSSEPTKKKQTKPKALFKPPKELSDPKINAISKQFSKFYSSHQNAAVSSTKAPPQNFQQNPHFETSFQPKPISISAIEEKPMSKMSQRSRKPTIEIEKEKLRASINKPQLPHNFKNESLKELPNKDRVKKESLSREVKKSIISLTKSQDSGLKVAHRDGGDGVSRPSFSMSMTGGRRRSFCNSQAELADFFSCNGVKVVSVDMPPFMQIHAVDCARKTCDSLEKFTSKTLAFTLKKEFDGIYGPAWHCIVGSSFGSFVTHSVGGFFYFSIDHKIYILLFKTTVQRAD